MPRTKKIAVLGIFTALAIVFGYFERIIPSPTAIPGIKLGFANVIVLTALYNIGKKEAFGISILRILATGFLFGNLSGIIYGLAGGVSSYAAMYAGKQAKIFSITGVSVLGGVSHNIGQIIIACAVVENMRVLYYLPVLVLSGIVTGIIVGFIAGFSILQIDKINNIANK